MRARPGSQDVISYVSLDMMWWDVDVEKRIHLLGGYPPINNRMNVEPVFNLHLPIVEQLYNNRTFLV